MSDGWHKVGETPKRTPTKRSPVSKAKPTKKSTTPRRKAPPSKKSTSPKGRSKSSESFIVDTREPDTMCRNFDTFRVKYQIRTLKFGDYKQQFCLAERKTIFDFVGSFRNGRLFTQLEGLIEENCYPFLVITGNMAKLKEDVHFKHIKENTVIGALASCMCRYGISVIWVDNDIEATMVMTQLFPVMNNGAYKKPNGTLPENFLALPRSTTDLMKEDNSRSEVMEKVAEIICNERVQVLWGTVDTVSLATVSRMFHKINEGKQGQARKRMMKNDAGSRTANLVRNYLRVEPTLAKSLIRSANTKGVGVMRYILESKNSTLLAHPGMGNVTLKRLRELVG